MAAWQYSVNLIPKQGVIRVHNGVPQSISVVRVTPETLREIDTVTTPNYWREVSGSFCADLESQLASWLPETDSWSTNARMFGSDDMHDQLSIWRDDTGNLERINVLISLSNPNPGNVTRLLAFPALADCLLHGIQSESVNAPKLENFLKDIRDCSAFRFLRGRDFADAEECG